MTKMLKPLALLAALSVAGAAHASFLDVNAFGGYTTLNMSDLNDMMSSPSYSYTNVTKINSGYYVGADAGFSFLPLVKVGPRIEYIGAQQGKATSQIEHNKFQEYTIDNNMILGELGVSSDWSLPASLGVSAGVWAGYGYATTKTCAQKSDTYNGGAFTAEAAARLKYSFMPLLSAGLEVGYRYAKVDKVKNGDETFGPSGKDLAIDFSGVNLGLGLNLNF